MTPLQRPGGETGVAASHGGASLHGGPPAVATRAASVQTLTPADVEAVACRVVELLRAERLAPARLVDAAELAVILGVTRETVYAHAAELGGARVGAGERPRLRFDVDRALEAWTARSAGGRSQAPGSGVVAPNRGGRPRASSGASADLLPIRGRRAA